MDYRLEQLRFELREDPSSRIFFKLGEHLRREGELQEAIAVLGNGLEQHPKYVAAWVSLGRALLDAGSSRQAADALGRALALDPENAVASRYSGEAAIANGEWVEAIKALKRARAMAGPDDALDERIRFVEGRLAEMGQLETPAPAPKLGSGWVSTPSPGRSLDQVFADEEKEPKSESFSDDVFFVEEVEVPAQDDEPPPENNGRATMAVPLAELPLPSSEVVSFADVSSDGDGDSTPEPVFEIDAGGVIEAAVEEAGDHRTDPELGAVAESEAVLAVETETDVPAEDDLEDVDEAEPPSDTVPLEVPEIATRQPDEDEIELQEDADTDAHSEELPLPTMTLARLALDQGDLDLAERTLRGVLEREPNHAEATALLAGLTAGADVDSIEGRSVDNTGDSRARALQRWLEAVRLTSERLKP